MSVRAEGRHGPSLRRIRTEEHATFGEVSEVPLLVGPGGRVVPIVEDVRGSAIGSVVARPLGPSVRLLRR
jgi:hypothetical protein